MTERHSRRDVLGMTGAGMGLTLSPTVIAGEGGVVERTAPKKRASTSSQGSLPAVRKSVLYLRHPDAPAIASPTDRQFVFLDVTSRGLDVGEVPSVADFALRVGGERYRAGRTVAGAPLEETLMWAQDFQATPYVDHERRHETRTGGPDVVTSREVGHGVLMLPAPISFDANDVAVELRPLNTGRTAATWSFDTTFTEALGSPPSFEVTTFEVPDRVERGEKESVSLSVENTGGRTDTFAAVFGLDGAEHPTGIEFTVPAGEEVTRDSFVQYPPAFEDVDAEADRAEFVLDIGHTRLRRTVTVAD